MEKSKGETYIGFCVRARKCKIGMNAVKTLKKAELLVVSNTASENTVSEGKKTARKLGCKMVITKEKPLEEMLHKENAKVMAITDKELAKAVYGQDKDFIESL